MADVPSARIDAFLAATKKLTYEKRGEAVGRSAESVRRWKRLARKQKTVPIDDDAAEKLEEYLGRLPPSDPDAYRQGLREAIRRMRATLEALEAELQSATAPQPAVPPDLGRAPLKHAPRGGREKRRRA